MIPRRKIRYYKQLVFDVFKMLFRRKINQGKYIKEFEKLFSNYIGVKRAISTSSGRVAYGLILDALELPDGAEVILPSYTYKEIFNITKDKGFKIKLVDVDPLNFNIDISLLKGAITNKTKVIVATHIFGIPCNIKDIISLADENGIIVIEDCAHSLGSDIDDRKTGGFGKASFFSFESTKILNTFGGGVITTNDDEIFFRINSKLSYSYGNYFKVLTKIVITILESLLLETFLNCFLFAALRSTKLKAFLNLIYFSSHNKIRPLVVRLSNLQSLIGIRQLRLVDEKNIKRKEAVKVYRKYLDKRLHIPRVGNGVNNVYYYFIAVLPDDFSMKISDFRDSLSRKGIDIGIMDEMTDNLHFIDKSSESFHITEKIYRRGFQLPLYDRISEEEIIKVSQIVNTQLKY